jgi:hypothetical protein
LVIDAVIGMGGNTIVGGRTVFHSYSTLAAVGAVPSEPRGSSLLTMFQYGH